MKRIVAWLVGRKLLTATGELDPFSRTKIIAVIGVVLAAIPQISTAWGHPIVIPDYIYKALGYAGLWTARDAIK